MFEPTEENRILRKRIRFEALRRLSPLDAAQAWIDGNFGFGDEPALIEALRKDSRITGSDDEIADTFFEAMDEQWTAQQCLDRLARQ